MAPTWQQKIAEAASAVGDVLSRTAASAQELLKDQELRKKGLAVVVAGAQSRLQDIQHGLQRSAGRINERLQTNKRNLQNLLSNIEQQIATFQRTRQLQQRRRQRVDVQFGAQLLGDVPQELRARLWYVLLENPHLAAPLKCEQSAPPSQAALQLDAPVPLSPPNLLDGEALAAAAGPGATSSGGAAPQQQQQQQAQSVGELLEGFDGAGPARGTAHSVPAAAAGSPTATAVSTGEGSAHSEARGSSLRWEFEPHRRAASPSPAAAAAGGQRTTSPPPETSAALRHTALSFLPGPDDEWELVDESLAAGMGLGGNGTAAAGGGAANVSDAVRIINKLLEGLGGQQLDLSRDDDAVAVAQQAVLTAMLQVPWVEGQGMPSEYEPDCRFAMLNEMTAGQEEVDDSIMRDIHRTFPEHPYFGLEAGQRALFRVLKAYSLHDLEVAYCQGMAFAVGVLLMFVPEEPAFRLFCRIMDPEGPNLRRLYLPGLDALKAELAAFELLLSWRMPELHAHLQAFGLPPVLYVSQWLMTLFATPFPPAFCARVIDVLLQDGHDNILQRCSYALMESLQEGLLALHDFEAIITYVKVEPVQWDNGKQRQVFERALASPLSDAELAVARDMVANRDYMLAGASSGQQEQQLVADAAAAAAGILPQKASFDLEAALEAAAVAAASSPGASMTASTSAAQRHHQQHSGYAPSSSGGAERSGPSGSAREAVDLLGDWVQEQPGVSTSAPAAAGAAGVSYGSSGVQHSGATAVDPMWDVGQLLGQQGSGQQHHQHIKIPGLDLDDEYLEMIMDLHLLDGAPAVQGSDSAAAGQAQAATQPAAAQAAPPGPHGNLLLD